MTIKKKTKNSETINVGYYMRKNAYVTKGKRGKTHLKVSPSAIKEMRLRIIESIEDNARGIAEAVHQDKGRKTIMVKYKKDKDGDLVPLHDDITKHFGMRDSKLVSGTTTICSKCLKKMER
jgi:hypothetical protein